MSRIPTPVITPSADDIKPCEGRAHWFESTNHADHAIARGHCLGTPNTTGCPFIGWCNKEREAFQASDYRGGLHGTWHGVLFIGGKASKVGAA
jgi:hypothetical protein